MASSANWLNIPDLPLVEIFTMLDFASLHKCRQICKKWNQLILRNVWGRKNKRRIMEQKFSRYWDTGIRQVTSSSRSLGFNPRYIAVSGDTIVLTDNLGEEGNTFLKILSTKELEEWSLPIHGNIMRCEISRNLILILLKDKNLSKRIEVYDTITRKKLVSRRLGANPRLFVDAPNILLRHFHSTSHIASEEIELMDIQDENKCFRYPLNEINCSKIISFNFPHLILYSQRRRQINVKIIDKQSKTINDLQKFDYDPDKFIKDCAFKDDHIFLLLSNTYEGLAHQFYVENVDRLEVLSNTGERINTIDLYNDVVSWNHTHCGYFIISGRFKRTNSVCHTILYKSRNLIEKNTNRSPSLNHGLWLSGGFIRPEELNKLYDVRHNYNKPRKDVVVISNHSIKHITVEQSSLHIDDNSVVY